MRGRSKIVALVVSALAVVGATAVASSAHPRHHDRNHGRHEHAIKHVLLISVDGLHQSDLAWYVNQHPGSELAKLAGGGAEYLRARTPIPSDSFPGMTALLTGGDPATTGIYYDASYNHDLLPSGTTSCPAGAPRGTAVNYDESIDKDPSSIDAGQGLSGLPGSILSLTSNPRDLINPAALPVDPSTCKPVYPNQYLKVNTVFDVAHQRGLLTAWSDKHPAYLLLAGPSGTGVDDFFTPEINSNAIGFPAGEDWTKDNAATQQYDSYKVQALINEIDGFNHSRTAQVGVPAIFGMNFQTVSTAEKLPKSDGLTGGYLPGTRTPGPLLSKALDYIDGKLAALDSELHAQGLADSTAIIVSAKHGQSPQDPNALTRIDDGPIIDAINAAWKSAHPGAGDLIVGGTDDDAWQSYLSDRSQAAADFVKNYLLSHPATGNTIDGSSRTLQSSGLERVFAGRAAARYFHVSPSDPRHPEVWGIVQHGVVYTGGHGKIAEHGGANPEDRDVPIVVYAPGAVRPDVIERHVETTQIAPTILRLLGLDPHALQAVRIEGTEVLPTH
jgi:hypothetical protein